MDPFANMPTLLSACILLSFMLYVILRRITAFSKLPLPPGPKPLPILGNLFDIPAACEYKVYAEWSKKYGNVIHVSAIGKPIVILNSVDAATDLLERRSAIYSDRPFIPMLHDTSLMDSNWTFIFSRYSPEWRRQRRLFIQHLGPTASRSEIHETQLKASAHALLRAVLRAPDELVAHLKHAAAEAILVITYGYQIAPTDDPLVVLAEHTGKIVGQGALPGRFLVNVFPWLKYVPAWFPGAGFKQHAALCREAQKRHIEMPFEYARRTMNQGTAPPSFVTSALTHASQDDSITDIKSVAATMYGAATETTSSVMHACILALILHPAVQERAQKELDNVIGSVNAPMFRLPTFEDRRYLPYIDAIVKETLRWFPVTPVGIPHSTTADDVYNGWRIPKGTIVIANSWSMLRDEKAYTEPLLFSPERFLGENPAPHPSLQGCFGFGRRECPGRHLAEATLWIQIASLLAVFTFLPAKDKDGRDIDINYAREPSQTLVLYPQDFPYRIALRSKEVELHIHDSNNARGNYPFS